MLPSPSCTHLQFCVHLSLASACCSLYPVWPLLAQKKSPGAGSSAAMEKQTLLVRTHLVHKSTQGKYYPFFFPRVKMLLEPGSSQSALCDVLQLPKANASLVIPALQGSHWFPDLICVLLGLSGQAGVQEVGGAEQGYTQAVNERCRTAWPCLPLRLVALRPYGMVLRDTDLCAQLHQVPQFHWARLSYACVTIHILTYLLFLVICVEGYWWPKDPGTV